MKKQIVIINGSGGSGKDTFVKLCRSYLSVFNISSVDKVKIAANILGWSGAKSDKDRRFLSDLKVLSSEYSDHPYKYIQECIEKFTSINGLDLMFIHIREPEEIERVKQDFGCKTLLVTNTNVSVIDTNMADANVAKYKYDYVIDNSGDLAGLEREAEQFIKELFE